MRLSISSHTKIEELEKLRADLRWRRDHPFAFALSDLYRTAKVLPQGSSRSTHRYLKNELGTSTFILHGFPHLIFGRKKTVAAIIIVNNCCIHGWIAKRRR